MANRKQIISDIAEVMGLKVEKNGTICHGLNSGYPFLLELAEANRAFEFRVLICANNMGQPIDSSIFNGINFMGNTHLFSSGYKINLVTMAEGSNDDMVMVLGDAISKVVNALKVNYYTGCDEMGGVYNIELYHINGVYCFYSVDNVANLQTRLTETKHREMAKPENVALGIIGAVLGACTGAAATFLLGRMNVLSFWASAASSIFCVILYRKFAGNFSFKGATVTGIISLLFAFFVPRLEGCLSVYEIYKKEGYEVFYDFREVFSNLKNYYEGFYYYRDIVLMTIIGIVAAVIIIVSALRSVANSDRIRKI